MPKYGAYLFLCKLSDVITCHWFLIALSQVNQIPQSWVELFHHILGEQNKAHVSKLHGKQLAAEWNLRSSKTDSNECAYN